jgi:putative heme-binding domain-containing protein
LATMHELAPASGEARSIWAQGLAGSELLDRVLRDESKPAHVRALALAMIPPPQTKTNVAFVAGFLSATDPRLQLEAVRTLASSSSVEVRDVLQDLAIDPRYPENLRAEAILGLLNQSTRTLPLLIELLEDPDLEVRIEAARGLRMHGFEESLEKRWRQLLLEPNAHANRPLLEQLQLALFPAGPPEDVPMLIRRPVTDAEWYEAVKGQGKADSGRRVFFHPMTGCARCHRVQGRGGEIGPDLSVIGRSRSREQLAEAILEPSRDIAPQSVTHILESKDGEVYSGLVRRKDPEGTVALVTADGTEVVVPADRIVTFAPLELSLMPEGLEQALTVQDFRDLLEFLQALR